MNRGEIRQHVRDILGEPGPYGFWDDDELNRFITIESDRHAQEALSAPAEVFTNSINGIIEYELPPDYAEMIRVWYLDSNAEGRRLLPYVKKGTLVQYSDVQSIGEPRAYYIFNDKMGLYPAPYQPPILAKNFGSDTGTGLNFTNSRIFDESRTGGGDPYTFRFDINLEEDSQDGVVLSPNIGYVAHIGLYLRRIGPAFQGMFRLGFTRDGYPNHLSLWKDLAGISPVPRWIYFDFTEDPIEIDYEERDVSGTVFIGDWSLYKNVGVGNLFLDVTSGDVTGDTLWINKIDGNGADRSSYLDTIEVGDVITIGVGAPTIQATATVTGVHRSDKENAYQFTVDTVFESGVAARLTGRTEAGLSIQYAGTPSFLMTFGTDQDYIDNAEEFQGGAQLGIDANRAPFFEMHPVRNDIIVEYYKNNVQILDDDNDISEIPDRYHRTIVDMVIARALEKDGYNMALSARYHERSAKAIRQARMQAKQATLGDIINTDDIAGRPDWTTFRDGKLVGRAW